MPDRGRPGSIAARLAATTRILAIEDEPDIAEFLRAYFRASGYDAVHLDPSSVDEVLDVADECRPDAILLDCQLRGFSGQTVYKRLRQEPRYARVPIIMVTADPTARPQAMATASAIDDFVAKPFNVNTLADTVADRIDAAKRDEQVEADDGSETVSASFLGERLAEEVDGTPPDRRVALVLIRVRSAAAVRRRAGDDGLTYLVRRVTDTVRDAVGDDASIWRTAADEVVAIVPDREVDDVADAMGKAVDGFGTEVRLPGGDTVTAEVVAGLAGRPAHASSGDELYMAADAALADAADAGQRLQVAL